MLYLLLSILSSTLIVLIFKQTEAYKIPVFQIVVINYFSAFALGSMVNNVDFINENITEFKWLPFAILIGAMFIVMFFLIGKSSRNSGVTVTTVATKMSVSLPVIFSIIYYSEEINLYKLLGILFAIVGILLTVYKPVKNKLKSFDYLPFVLFFGAGTIDIFVKFTQNEYITNESSALFSAVSFASAAIIGTITAFFNPFKLKSYFEPKVLLSGILLGAANFGSLFFLILALNSEIFDSSIVFGLNNTGIVLLATGSAYLLFVEKQSKINITGIIISTMAVLLLSIA